MSGRNPSKLLAEYEILKRPRVVVRVVEDPDGRRFHRVVEPELSEYGKAAVDYALSAIKEDMDLLHSFSDLTDLSEGIREAYRLTREYIAKRAAGRRFRIMLIDKVKWGNKGQRDNLNIDAEALAAAYYVARDLVGFGRLDPLLRDPYVEDISVNGLLTPVFVYHTEFEWLTSNITFTDPDELERVVVKLALRSGVEPNLARPVVEGVLRPEGYRVHIVLDVVSRRGHSVTVRKFRAEPYTLVELLRRRTLSPEVAALLWMAIQYKQGVIVYGPTGAGKTTLLNALAMLLPPEYKVVTVEDTPEIYLPFHDNWAAMHTRLSDVQGVQSVTLQSQVESALRMRPDVIIVGEIRSREAYAFFQAVATGHGGLTTIHAENADVLMRRLASPPMNVPRSLLASAKLLVNIVRVERGGKVMRRVLRVDETHRYDPAADELELKRIAQWSSADDSWTVRMEGTSLLKTLSDLLAVSPQEILEDYHRRIVVLEWAAARNLDIFELHQLVRRYMRDPEETYREAAKALGGGG